MVKEQQCSNGPFCSGADRAVLAPAEKDMCTDLSSESTGSGLFLGLFHIWSQS